MADDRLFRQIPAAMSRLDTNLTVRAQNDLSSERFGETSGRPCYEAHFGRSSRCPGCDVDRVLQRRQVGRWYLTDDRPGKPAHHEVTLAPVLNERGEVEELVEIIRDASVRFAVEKHLIGNSEELEQQVEQRTAELVQLTEQTGALRGQLQELKRDQAALVQTEKMASVGRLAAGLTHEIHTPLGALLSNEDMLERCVVRIREGVEQQGAELSEQAASALSGQLETATRLIELQRTAALRLKKIVGSLREFAHLDRAELESYDLHEGIDAALALLSHEIGSRIEIETDYGELAPVICRPDALNQVFMNLLENAVAAIEERGRIRISTRIDAARPDEVMLEFEDNGRGIAPENMARILEPGFTTKPRGVGTGLGLPIAQRTISDHGGRIEVRSELGKGTIFTLHLPIRGRD
jgi:signal transduction histidine kinase